MPVYKAPIYKAPIYGPTWAGAYIGVNAGYGWGNSSIDVIGDAVTLADFTGIGIPTSVKVSPKGFLGGATAGYNWQHGKLVYGIEGDFDFATIKGSGSATAGVFVNSGAEKIDMFSTVRGRLGYTVWDSFLVYGTGGLAMGHAKLSSSLADAVSTDGNSDSKWLVGWTVGAGAEYQLSRSWSVKGEYLYYSLGKIQTSYTVGPVETVEAQFKGNIVRLGLNYHF